MVKVVLLTEKPKLIAPKVMLEDNRARRRRHSERVEPNGEKVYGCNGFGVEVRLRQSENKAFCYPPPSGVRVRSPSKMTSYCASILCE